MTTMYVPEPVISWRSNPRIRNLRIICQSSESIKKDPTFKTFVDPESNETIIRGMGELHLDIYIERMRRSTKWILKPECLRLLTVKQSLRPHASIILIRSRPVELTIRACCRNHGTEYRE